MPGVGAGQGDDRVVPPNPAQAEEEEEATTSSWKCGYGDCGQGFRSVFPLVVAGLRCPASWPVCTRWTPQAEPQREATSMAARDLGAAKRRRERRRSSTGGGHSPQLSEGCVARKAQRPMDRRPPVHGRSRRHSRCSMRKTSAGCGLRCSSSLGRRNGFNGADYRRTCPAGRAKSCSVSRSNS